MTRRKLSRRALLMAFVVCAVGITTQVFSAEDGQVEPQTPNFVYYVNPKDG
jgi:hypothetical protein